MDTFWSQGKSGRVGSRLWTPDPHGPVPWFTLAALCALVLSMGGAAGTIQARQSDQAIAQPAHFSLEKFLLNH